MNRRGFITGLIAAPLVARASSLMALRGPALIWQPQFQPQFDVTIEDIRDRVISAVTMAGDDIADAIQLVTARPTISMVARRSGFSHHLIIRRQSDGEPMIQMGLPRHPIAAGQAVIATMLSGEDRG